MCSTPQKQPAAKVATWIEALASANGYDEDTGRAVNSSDNFTPEDITRNAEGSNGGPDIKDLSRPNISSGKIKQAKMMIRRKARTNDVMTISKQKRGN